MPFTSSVDEPAGDEPAVDEPAVDEPAPVWRDVYIAAVARSVSYCGDFLAATALALTLQTRGDNGYAVAALMIAAVLPVALLGPLGGRLADRFDSRRILVTVGLAQAVVCLVLAYVSAPIVMVVLVAVVSAGLALTQPTLSALTPAMVGRANLGRAMSIGQTASAVGMLIGPVLGGLLVGAYGVRPPLLADAASFLALAGAGLALRTRRGGAAHAPAGRETAATGAATGALPWRLRRDRLLVTLIGGFGAVIAAMTAVNVAEIFFVRETLGASAAVYGLVSAGWMAGLLVGAWPWGRVRGSDRRLVIIQLSLLLGISVVVFASAGVPAALWLLPLYLLGGALNSGLNVLSGVVVGRRAPEAVRGQVFGVFGAVGNGANMIGYVAGGLLLPVFAPRTIMAGTGIAGLAVSAVFLLMVLKPTPATAAAVEAVPVG
jgi:MFS family permease